MDDILYRLNLTQDEFFRFQSIRIRAITQKLEREKVLEAFGCNDDVGVEDKTDTEFLLNLLDRLVTK